MLRQRGQINNLPIVGIVVTISPSFNLYKIVVFPAASSPTMRMRISFLPIKLANTFVKKLPIVDDFLI